MNPMGKDQGFWRSGHAPTLITAFLYFDVSFMVWMVNAAMAPFLSQQFGLAPSQKGLMLSIPVFAGALLRIPLGLVAEIIGKKTAALLGMGITLLSMLYGYAFVDTYREVLVMGGLLGVAGASFAVALPLGSGSFPPRYQGLAMGIAGAGNSGTVLAGLFAAPLAKAYGWNNVYGFFAVPVLLVMAALWLLAKEPPDRGERHGLLHYLKILVEGDVWTFNLLYWVTFGGFVGFSSFVPTFMADQYGVDKISAGRFMILIGLTASAVRIFGGWISDHIGGIRALTGIYLAIAAAAIAAGALPGSIAVMFALLFVMAAAMGAGNGAVFQLLPLRYPRAKAITSGVVGEFGALGGACIPLMMGYSKELTGSFSGGFVVYGLGAVAALGVLLLVQARWTSTWVGKGGRALCSGAPAARGAAAEAA